MWDHLLAHEPVFLLPVLVAYVKLHGPALLAAGSAQQACATLLVDSVLRVEPWMKVYNIYIIRPTTCLRMRSTHS